MPLSLYGFKLLAMLETIIGTEILKEVKIRATMAVRKSSDGLLKSLEEIIEIKLSFIGQWVTLLIKKYMLTITLKARNKRMGTIITKSKIITRININGEKESLELGFKFVI